MPQFIQIGLINSDTASIGIEYADYAIARNFIECFCEWAKGCDQDKIPKIILFLKNISSAIALTTKYSVLFFMLYIMYFFAENHVHAELTARSFAQLGIIFSGIFVIFSDLGMRLGRSVQFFIDTYSPASYLHLNKGDEKIINQDKSNIRHKLIALVTKFVSAIILGVITKIISGKLI